MSCISTLLVAATLAGADPSVRLTLSPTADNPRNSEGAFITLKDGTILFIYTHFFGGDGDDAAAHLASRTSTDGGQTWTPQDQRVPAVKGRQNTMSVSLLRLKSGKIGLFYLVKHSNNDCRTYMQVSDDEARTWGEARLCMAQEGYYVVNNDRVVQLASGRLVIPAAWHKQIAGVPFNFRATAVCFISDDEGQSWRQAKGIVEPPRDSNSGLQEPGIVELKDGRLLMISRTDLGSQYRSYSPDGGETWSPAEASDIKSPLSPASIKRIPGGGDLLLVWNDHARIDEALKGKRTPLCVAVSPDDGKTWSEAKVIEDDRRGSYCYTAIEFVGDHVLLAYCAEKERGDGLNTLRITSVPLSWLQDR